MPCDTAPPPLFVVELERVWNSLRDLSVTSNQRKEDLGRRLKELTGCKYDACPWDSPHTVGALRDAATKLAAHLTAFEERALAPPHAALTIDPTAATEAYRQLEARIRRRRDEEPWEDVAQRIARVWSGFSVVRAWHRLRRRYTPATAASHAYQSAAATLIAGLQLHRRPPTATKRGVVFALWADAGHQRSRYSHGTVVNVSSIWDALRVAAALEMGADAATQLAGGSRTIAGWYDRIAPRARHDLGGGVHAETQLSQILLTLPHALGEATMRFIANHAPDHLRNAA
jgi:hypothetical protein